MWEASQATAYYIGRGLGVWVTSGLWQCQSLAGGGEGGAGGGAVAPALGARWRVGTGGLDLAPKIAKWRNYK
jgi:hypothetical protein